ncbi:MAG: Na+/H+ antiporter subunit B [Bacteroidetes bacterium]|nr:Na+/H+ antiporter subunit B [Bacteroidota bacterium]HET6244491.1 Na+/H+ antiporter subunit B [Bacteroidia bacterium]
MKSKLFTTASRFLLPLLLLFSIFLLIRGHNEPGGGFVGGLVASTAFALYTIANGVKYATATLQVKPGIFIATGLSFAVGSGILPLFFQLPFLTGLWSDFHIPAFGKLSTPLLFDVGVFLVVFGVTNTIVFSLAED